MTTRRRWIAGIGLGFLGAALAIGALNFRSERPDVQILFLGYTNVPVKLRMCLVVSGSGDSVPLTVRKAMLVVTNCGRVPVQLLPIWEAHGRTNVLSHLRSYLQVKSSVLKPGESAQATLTSGREGATFRAELAYYRLDLSHRLSQQARSSTNAAMRAVANLFPRTPKPRWARGQPIANSP